jgi:hypothetical protein
MPSEQVAGPIVTSVWTCRSLIIPYSCVGPALSCGGSLQLSLKGRFSTARVREAIDTSFPGIGSDLR